MTINEEDVEDFLTHYGVKGMKWGTRKNYYEGASNKTNREARKDASEFARAQMFYGEGAGTRRKLIRATVDAKTKKDQTYKMAFEHHLNLQSMDKHAEKARSERKRKDVKKSVGKNVRGINRAINGPFATPVAATAVVAGVSYAHAKGYDKKVADAGMAFLRSRGI